MRHCGQHHVVLCMVAKASIEMSRWLLAIVIGLSVADRQKPTFSISSLLSAVSLPCL